MTEQFVTTDAVATRRGRPGRRWFALGGALVVLVLVAAACGGSSETGATATTEASAAPVNFSVPGPYPVGRTVLPMGDRQVWVFYPADPAGTASVEKLTKYSSIEVFPEALKAVAPPQLVQDIPIDAYRDALASTAGPFPVVIHSHGVSGHAALASRHLNLLASWGFVGAAVEYPERDLAANALGQQKQADDVAIQGRTLALLTEQNGTGPLAGIMNLDLLAAEGHSAGGSAALRFAADPAVKTVIGQAPGAGVRIEVPEALTGEANAEARAAFVTQALDAAYASTPPPDKPSMIIAGELDAIIPLTSIEKTFAWLAPPKRFAVIKNAGHFSFGDFCEPIQTLGGVTQFARQIPVPEGVLQSADDGCLPSNLEAETAYGVIDHLTVAQLRNVFGIEAPQAAASLERSYLDQQFPGTLAQYEYKP